MVGAFTILKSFHRYLQLSFCVQLKTAGDGIISTEVILEQWPCHIDRHPAIGHVNQSIKKGMALGVTFFAHAVTFSTRCRRNLICRDELC